MPPRQRSREEAEEMVEQLARVSSELAGEESHQRRAQDQVERFIKYAWAFGLIVSGVTGWQFKVQSDISHHELEIVRINAVLEATRIQYVKDALVLQGIQTQISGNTRELEKRSETVTRVNEMWWMKEHGISNKEAFQQRNGYPAPNPSEK